MGYFDQSDRSLRRIFTNGGPAQRLTTSLDPTPGGASWGPDGTILFARADGIWQAPEDGGEARRVIATEPGEQAGIPRRLPRGDWVLFSLARSAGGGRWDAADVVAQSIGSGERRLAVTGAPVPVVQGVRRAVNPAFGAGEAQYGLSMNGTLVYIPGSATGNVPSTLAWVDPAGHQEALDLPPAQYAHPRLSPDGKWLAVEREDGSTADIWLYDLSGAAAERRLTEGGNNRYPVWTRDGTYLVFQSDREGDRGVFRKRADGSGAAERLTRPEPGIEHVPEAWSPTADRLAISYVAGNRVELWIWTLATRAAERVGMLEATRPFDTAFSPDGKWIAYTQRESEGMATYVQPVGANSKYQVGRTEELIHHPLWSRDGKRQIYFQANSPVAATIRTEPTVAIGRPEPLPGLPLNVQPSSLLNHDVGRDGRFVTLFSGQEATGAAPPDQIVIVQNWFEELKRLVPVK